MCLELEGSNRNAVAATRSHRSRHSSGAGQGRGTAAVPLNPQSTFHTRQLRDHGLWTHCTARLAMKQTNKTAQTAGASVRGDGV